MADRTHVVLRPRDNVRCYVTVSARQRTPFNIEHRFGWYGRAWSEGGTVRYARADRSVPPFDVQSVVSVGPGDTHPRMAYDFRERLWIQWQRSAGSAFAVYQAVSDDDGTTWGTEAVLFADGKYPDVAVDPLSKTIIFTVWVSNGLQGRIQEIGDVTPGATFTLTDQVGAALSLADDTYHIAPAYDTPGRYLLTLRRLGATEISEYYSTDGRTWTLIT